MDYQGFFRNDELDAFADLMEHVKVATCVDLADTYVLVTAGKDAFGGSVVAVQGPQGVHVLSTWSLEALMDTEVGFTTD